MAWVVNSFLCLPQPSCPPEGQLSWVRIRVGGLLRLGWCVKASLELISPFWLHLQGQVAFTLQILGEVVVTLGP